MKQNIFVVVAFAFLIFTGCSRPSSNTTRLTLSVPQTHQFSVSTSSKIDKSKKVSALAATGSLFHLVINVRGAGIQAPISLNFDADKHNGSAPTAIPNTVSIEVPAGSARLIQVMAVYVDPATMIGSFQYGDVTTDLSSGSQSVSINVESLGTGSVKGGKIQGRFMSSTFGTPSGMVETRFQPPQSKPAVVINRSTMVNGWFQAFALPTIPFDVWVDGVSTPLFQNFTLNNLTLSGDQVVRVTLPERVQNYGGGGGSENRESESVVLGFFGDAVPVANKVCIKDSAYVFSKLFQTDGTTPMTVVTTADPNKISIESDGSVTDCSVPDVSSFLTSVIPIDYSLMDNWGGIEAIGSRYGVFAFPATGDMSPAQMTVDTGTNKFSSNFTLMPGAYPFVDSVSIYYRASNSPRDYESDRDVICQDIASGKYGFRLLASVNLASAQFDYPLTNRTRPADLSGSSVAAFCPMKNGKMLGTGYISDHINTQNTGGGGGGGGGPVAAVGIFKNGSPLNFVGMYSCFDFTIQLRNSTGGLASNTSARNINFVVPAGMYLYANGSDCFSSMNALSSGGLFNGSIPGGQSEIRYWIKTDSVLGSFTLVANSVGLTSPMMNFSVLASGYFANLDMPESLVPGICYPSMVRTVYLGGSDYSVTGDTVISLASSNASLGFYSNSDCRTGTSSVTVLNGTSSVAVWVKLGAAVNGEITVGSSAGGFQQADFRRISGMGSTTPSQLAFAGGNNTFPTGSCSGPYSISILNSNFTPVVATAAKTIGLLGRVGVSFYPSSNCTGAITTLPLAVGEYRKLVWIKYSSAGPDTINAQVAGWASATMNLTINGLHHYNLFADITNPAHGGCVQLGIDPRNYPSGSGSFNYSDATAFQYQGFPAGTLFKNRVNGECIGLLTGSPVTLSKMANSGAGPFVYYRALNPTGSMLNTLAANYHIESAGVSAGDSLNINVAVAPAMTLADSAAGEVASDYPFFIEDIVNRFTGRPTFLFEANTAGWTPMASTSIPSGTPRDVRVTDSSGAQQSYTATGRVSSYTADFTTGTLPTNWSYTSSGAYGVNGLGYLAWFGANTALWDRNPDPASGYAIRGLKVEAGITNLVAPGSGASEDFSLWNINPGGNGYAQVSRGQSSGTTPEGNTSPLKWYLDDNNGGNAANVEHAIFGVSVTNGNKYVMSIFMKRNTSRFAAFQFNGYGGSSMSSGVVVDLDTGNFSGLTGPYTPNTNLGVGAEKYRDGWYRVWVKFQAQDPNGFFMIFPAFCSAGAGVLCTSGEINASGSVFVWGAQLEQSESMTSYVPSVSGGVRSPSSVAISSTSLIGGFTSTQGAIRLETASVEPRDNMDLLRIGNASNNYTIFSATTSAEVSVDVTSSGTLRATATNLLPVFGGGPNVISFSYSNAGSNNLNAGANDLSFASGPNSIWPSVTSLPLQIGGSFSRGAGTASIKKFQYWPNRFGLPGVKSISRP